MSEKERLIELIDDFGDDVSLCDICNRPREDCEGCTNEQLAEYLLENGVIVPPVKVGQTVYYVGGMYHHLIKSAKIEAFDVNQDGISELYVCSENGVCFQDKVDKFYSSKEEAEKALKGGAE